MDDEKKNSEVSVCSEKSIIDMSNHVIIMGKKK